MQRTPCTVWTGALNHDGYGMTTTKARAHRVAYEAVHGPIPVGLEIDHLCNVRACVRVDHLEAVTHQENMRRRFERSPGGGANQHTGKTHCSHGHEFTPENTRVDKAGARKCRVCHRERLRRNRAQAAMSGSAATMDR